MEYTTRRVYQLDGDALEVIFRFDLPSGKYYGQYPDFTEKPRYTPNGHMWVNVTNVGCPYADKRYDDCGSCQYLKREQERDLIGICQHTFYRRE